MDFLTLLRFLKLYIFQTWLPFTPPWCWYFKFRSHYYFFSTQVYETVNHETNRWVLVLFLYYHIPVGISGSGFKPLCGWTWNDTSCVSLTGPLRVVAVLLLVGLTWLLANTFFGEDSGSAVRHFFSGKRNGYVNRREVINLTGHFSEQFIKQDLQHSLVVTVACEDLGGWNIFWQRLCGNNIKHQSDIIHYHFESKTVMSNVFPFFFSGASEEPTPGK